MPPLEPRSGCVNAPGPARFLNRSRLSARGETATIRNGTPCARNWLNVSATRGTSSGAVSRSLTSRIGPFGWPARSSAAWATGSPDEICLPPEKQLVHGSDRCGHWPGIGAGLRRQRSEVAEQRLQLHRGGAGRQQLIRDVGEGDQADARVRVDQLLQDVRDRPVRLGLDAARDVENEHPPRSSRDETTV